MIAAVLQDLRLAYGQLAGLEIAHNAVVGIFLLAAAGLCAGVAGDDDGGRCRQHAEHAPGFHDSLLP